MSISPPVKITTPFATSGIKAAIPATSDPVDGRAGYNEGFPAINFQPKVAGGIPPWGEDFNGIFFEVTQALQFLEAGGSFPYDGTWATAVGGYPAGALVSRSDNSGLWRNTAANNTTDPEIGGAGWQPEDAGATSITMTNANVTLTPLQAARSVIIITGTLTANLQLIFPAYVKQWQVINNTTGAFTILCKTAAGSGVIAQNGSTQIIGDGSAIVYGASGALIGVQVFTASGTYTPTAGTKSVIVEVVGGGGAGGGAQAAGGNWAPAGGGGGGGCAQSRLTSGFSGVTVTVGAGGIGASAANGNPGGTSSFGALLSATGGNGGTLGSATSIQGVINGGAQGGQGVGGNLLNAKGGQGFNGNATSTSNGISGAGGSSILGGGGNSISAPTTADGISATTPGGGGGGAISLGGGAARVGGNGAAGIVVVWEYA